MKEPERSLYSLLEASQVLGGASIWTLRKHIARGTIHVTRIGRRVFLPCEEIERIRREGLPSLRTASLRRSNEHESRPARANVAICIVADESNSTGRESENGKH